MPKQTAKAKPTTKAMPTDPRKRFRTGWGRWVCYGLIGLAVLVLGYFELTKPTLTEDAVLQPLLTMTVTRLVGAAVFLAILLYEGYKVLNPVRRPFLRSLLFILPPLAVVINNMPILSMLRGDAYLIHTGWQYLFWFAMECLSIGLFEELAFRGVVLLMLAEKRHASRRDLFLCIILSSAVFGLVHLTNLLTGSGFGAVIQQIGYSFLIGAMCSVVLYRTANLWLCVLLHAIYDFCGSLVPTLGAGTWWDAPTVVFTVLLALVVTVYMVVALWRTDPASLDRIYAPRDSE